MFLMNRSERLQKLIKAGKSMRMYWDEGVSSEHAIPCSDWDETLKNYEAALAEPFPANRSERLRELVDEIRQIGETQRTTGFPNSANMAFNIADKLAAALAEPAAGSTPR